jgi:hypothetical protein
MALASAPSAAQPLTPEELSSTEEACRSGKADLCGALAWMYAQGSRVPTDLPRAALLAQRGCQLGSERACAMRQQIARLQSVEKELAQESAKVGAGVAQAVEKCNEGEVVFCVMAAFYSGLTVDERTAEARLNLYLDKACAIDSSEACLASLALYEDSPPQIQARYDSRHFIQKTCEKACNAKSWQACYMLGEFNKAGKHMPRDSARAFSFYSRACDGGFLRACGDVGVAYLRNEATPRDMPQVLQALGQGCEAENGGACVALGLLSRHGVQGVPQNLEKALGFFQRACQLGQEVGCKNAAALPPPPAAPARTAEAGDVKPLQPLVIELFERRCDEGSGGDCLELARVFNEGKRVPRDVARALGFATQGCKQHNREACSLQGKLERTPATSSPLKK